MRYQISMDENLNAYLTLFMINIKHKGDKCEKFN